METNSPEAFFRQIPPITKFILVATFFITLGSVVGLFNVRWIILDWVLISKKVHLWRLVTDYFFVGNFSLGWIFHMYFFVTFASKLESHPSFAPRVIGHGGFLFFIFLQMIALDLISLVFYAPKGKPILGGALNFAIIYYWSKKEPFATVGLWGFSLVAWQAPYALLVLDILMGQSIWDNLMGIATGHLYHVIKDVLPVEQNIRLLDQTPAIFGTLTQKLDFMHPSNLFSSSSSSSTATAAARPTSAAAAQSSGRIGTLFSTGQGGSSSSEFPGRGYRLGGDSGPPS